LAEGVGVTAGPRMGSGDAGSGGTASDETGSGEGAATGSAFVGANVGTPCCFN